MRWKHGEATAGDELLEFRASDHAGKKNIRQLQLAGPRVEADECSFCRHGRRRETRATHRRLLLLRVSISCLRDAGKINSGVLRLGAASSSLRSGFAAGDG